MVTVGLYLRLSVEGEGAGIERQQEDTTRLAESRGWDWQLYVDPAKSAYKRRVKRPEFERLLDDLSTGVIGGLIVWDIDRLARQPRDLERLIDLFQANSQLVFGTCQGEINLGTSDGCFMARSLVNVANKSSSDTGRRVARSHLQLAQKGIPVGGSRPFGWLESQAEDEPGGIEVDEGEASYIRDAARDIIAGKGVRTVTREWNEAGLTSPRGKPWSKQVVRNLLMSPRLAGYRVYRGQIAINEDTGKPVKGIHKPILDVETWETLRAVLTDPARSSKHVHYEGRKYLLSGVARCGLCGSLMRGNADKRANNFNYQCGSCGKVAINGPKTDERVSWVVEEMLRGRKLPEEQAWPKQAELDRVTEKMAELMLAYTDEGLSAQVVFPAVARLEAQDHVLRDEQTVWLRSKSNAAALKAMEWYAENSLEQRRKVIEISTQSVIVSPAKLRGRIFDPERIEVVQRALGKSYPTLHLIKGEAAPTDAQATSDLDC